MRIAIFSRMPSNVYSGGRYHVWMMAEALCYMHNEVYVITDNNPIFSKDFQNYTEHHKLQMVINHEFKTDDVSGDFDYVYLIPGIMFDDILYQKTLQFAVRRRAKIVLLNFETTNWFNSY